MTKLPFGRVSLRNALPLKHHAMVQLLAAVVRLPRGLAQESWSDLFEEPCSFAGRLGWRICRTSPARSIAGGKS